MRVPLCNLFARRGEGAKYPGTELWFQCYRMSCPGAGINGHGKEKNFLHQTGFEPRIIQPVTSRYKVINIIIHNGTGFF